MRQDKELMILVAGPYRSGTNDQPLLIEENLKRMTDTAIQLFEMGHLPVLGEWYALPLIKSAGSQKIGDEIFNKYFHPISLRIINHCDGVLRIGGPSDGADHMVAAGLNAGKIIFYSLKEIPNISIKK